MSRAGFIEQRRIWALMRCVPQPDDITMKKQRRASKSKKVLPKALWIIH